MDDKAGEQGDGCGRWSLSELHLARRAIRDRWGVPDAMRTVVLDQAGRIMSDATASHRDKVAAAKLLLEADRHDLMEDKLALEIAKFEHDTKPPDNPADDYTIDLSDEPYQGDPAQPGDGPAT